MSFVKYSATGTPMRNIPAWEERRGEERDRARAEQRVRDIRNRSDEENYQSRLLRDLQDKFPLQVPLNQPVYYVTLEDGWRVCRALKAQAGHSRHAKKLAVRAELFARGFVSDESNYKYFTSGRNIYTRETVSRYIAETARSMDGIGFIDCLRHITDHPTDYGEMIGIYRRGLLHYAPLGTRYGPLKDCPAHKLAPFAAKLGLRPAAEARLFYAYLKETPGLTKAIATRQKQEWCRHDTASLTPRELTRLFVNQHKVAPDAPLSDRIDALKKLKERLPLQTPVAQRYLRMVEATLVQQAQNFDDLLTLHTQIDTVIPEEQWMLISGQTIDRAMGFEAKLETAKNLRERLPHSSLRDGFSRTAGPILVGAATSYDRMKTVQQIFSYHASDRELADVINRTAARIAEAAANRVRQGVEAHP